MACLHEGGLKEERNDSSRCLLVPLRFISISPVGSVNYPILKTSTKAVVSIWVWLLILFCNFTEDGATSKMEFEISFGYWLGKLPSLIRICTQLVFLLKSMVSWEGFASISRALLGGDSTGKHAAVPAVYGLAGE